MNFDKLIQRLEEGTSPLRKLYHNTVFSSLEKLLYYNSFHCGYNDYDLEYKKEKFKKYPFFMSAARIPNNNFARVETVMNEFSMVCLELNALKLSDNGYPIRPINFFSSSDRQESEDRVLSKKSCIKDFNQYIDAFHIFFHPNDIERLNTKGFTSPSLSKTSFNDIIKDILQTGKPSYVYRTRNEFHSLNRTKRELLSENHLIP